MLSGRVAPRAEIAFQIARRAVSVGLELFEATERDAFELYRDLGTDLAGRLRIGLFDSRKDLVLLSAIERQFARQQLVQTDAERPGIGARIDLSRFAPYLLGRHVVHGSRQQAFLARPLVHVQRKPEIQHVRTVSSIHKDVVGLEIAMKQALRMGNGEHRRDVCDHGGKPIIGVGSFLLPFPPPR